MKINQVNPNNYYTFVLSTELANENSTKTVELVARNADFLITRIRTRVLNKNGIDVMRAAENNAGTMGCDNFFVEMVDDNQQYHSNEPVPIQDFSCGGGDRSYMGQVLPQNRIHKFKVSATPSNGVNSTYPVTVRIIIDGYYLSENATQLR